MWLLRNEPFILYRYPPLTKRFGQKIIKVPKDIFPDFKILFNRVKNDFV